MRFKNWLESRYDFDYTSIGHSFSGNYDTWAMKSGSDEITYASNMGKDPEQFHTGFGQKSTRQDYTGRIDHDKKMISIAPQINDPEKLDYVIQLLKSDYPQYSVYLFDSGRAPKLV